MGGALLIFVPRPAGTVPGLSEVTCTGLNCVLPAKIMSTENLRTCLIWKWSPQMQLVKVRSPEIRSGRRTSDGALVRAHVQTRRKEGTGQ